MQGRQWYQGGFEFSDAEVGYLDPSSVFAPVAHAQFDPGQVQHTYRLEFAGNHIKLLIDGNLMVNATDNQFLDPGQVGLSNGPFPVCQVEVPQFKVLAI
jgi:hypothetical protein